MVDLVQSGGASRRAVSANVTRSAISESGDATYISRNHVDETAAIQEASGNKKFLTHIALYSRNLEELTAVEDLANAPQRIVKSKRTRDISNRGAGNRILYERRCFVLI